MIATLSARMIDRMAQQTIPNVPDSQVPVVTGRLQQGGATNITTLPHGNGRTTITADAPSHPPQHDSRATVNKSVK